MIALEGHCPNCGKHLVCLAGRDASVKNWYCSDEKGCGWRAWDGKAKMEEVMRSTPTWDSTKYNKIKKLQSFMTTMPQYVAQEAAAKVSQPDVKDYIDIFFKDLPSDTPGISGRDVEVQDPIGKSFKLGEWFRVDGYWALRIYCTPTGEVVV